MRLLKILYGKAEQFSRLLLVNLWTPYNKSVLVVEYPKSGGTWLGQLISGCLVIPFPRNRFPILKRALFHGHYLPKGRITKNKRIILLVRDGRDVMVSYYHHQLIWNNKNKLTPNKVNYYRKTVGFTDYENVKANMNKYLEYAFTHVPPKTQHFIFPGNWSQFHEQWLKSDNLKHVHIVRYEDLLTDCEATLKNIFTFLGETNVAEAHLKKVIAKYAFENQTKRQKGEADKTNFLRKGIQGDWKNYFEEPEKKTFKKHAQHMLKELGYVNNANW